MELVLALVALAVALAALYLVTESSKKTEASVRRHAEIEFGRQTKILETLESRVDRLDGRLEQLEKSAKEFETRLGHVNDQVVSLWGAHDDGGGRDDHSPSATDAEGDEPVSGGGS